MLRPDLAAPMATLPLRGPSRAAAPAVAGPRRPETAAGRDRREMACTGPDGRLVVLRRLD